MKNKVQKLLIGLVILIFGWLAGSFFGSYYVTRTHFQELPSPEQYFDQAAHEIELTTVDNIPLNAWWIPQDTGSISVILLNGIGANKSSMAERAKIYLDQGFNVLLPDLRGTGESGGELITFGWKERLDLMACYLFLQEKGYREIAAHGISLGAAAIAYSLELKPKYRFVVLESPYDNIENALNNRLEMYHVPKFLSIGMIYLTEARIEVEMQQLSPELSLRALDCPTLLMAGDSERKVKKTETEKIFGRIGSPHKQLHFFAGARHENFLKKDEKGYEKVLKNWLISLKFEEQ